MERERKREWDKKEMQREQRSTDEETIDVFRSHFTNVF